MNAICKKERAYKTKVGDYIFSWGIIFFMSLFALSFLFIFIWMLLNSFRNPASYNKNPLGLFDFSDVQNIFDNYKEVFAYEVRKTILVNGKRQSITINVLGMLKNSFLVYSHIKRLERPQRTEAFGIVKSFRNCSDSAEFYGHTRAVLFLLYGIMMKNTRGIAKIFEGLHKNHSCSLSQMLTRD